jgi:hypothetical protein
LRTADGLLCTRDEKTETPNGHLDELLPSFNACQKLKLNRSLIHVIDREADSVGHYRQWQEAGHYFLVRANLQRTVNWRNEERNITAVRSWLRGQLQPVLDQDDKPLKVTIQAGVGEVKVAEVRVILTRPAKRNTGQRTKKGHKQKQSIPGSPLPVRLILTQVVDDAGKVLSEWLLFTNLGCQKVAGQREVSAAELGAWYAWRWNIETYHKLLKSAGQQAESWLQESGSAFLRRLCVASMACLTVWQLQRAEGEEAKWLRVKLVKLSGRLMKSKVESTAPALFAGLERLLAVDDFMDGEDLGELLRVARKLLPNLFPKRDDDS